MRGGRLREVVAEGGSTYCEVTKYFRTVIFNKLILQVLALFFERYTV